MTTEEQVRQWRDMARHPWRYNSATLADALMKAAGLVEQREQDWANASAACNRVADDRDHYKRRLEDLQNG